MFPTRAIGYLRPPSREQVVEYASRHHLSLDGAEADQMVAAVTASLEMYTRVEELDEPSVPLRHPYRDPGRAPRSGEDPYNAFIRFCEVRGTEDGPLAGKTVGVKDCIAVAGVPTTNGGRRTPAVAPTEDAVVVERLLDAGATITGKTNLEDLALGLGEGSAFGASRNPVNPAFATGGSSSGSGAAVAAGLVDMALGADEGGSVRIPAAWCGLVGMKATHGLVPSYGLTYMDHTIDHIGPMTKTVADNALMLEVMAGSDWRDPQWVRTEPTAGAYTAAGGQGVEGLRIGVISEALEASGCSADVLEAFDSAQKLLVDLGAVITDVSIPLWTDSRAIGLGALGLGLYGMAISYGIGFSHLGRVDPSMTAAWASQTRQQAADLPEMLKSTLLTTEHLLSCYQGVPIAKSQNLRLEMRRQAAAALAGVDLMMTPTIPTVAYELLDRRAQAGEMAERNPWPTSPPTWCPGALVCSPWHDCSSGHELGPVVTVACIAVDVQNDFTESGPFALSGHDAIARAIGSYVAQHRHHYDLVITTQDWYVDPGDHFVADVSGASSPSNKDRAESELAVAGAEIALGNVVGP